MKILLLGKAGAGKDTVADYLVEQYCFWRYAFADAIKNIAWYLFPEQFEGGRKPRKLLQDLGAKIRELDEDVWVWVVLREITADQPARAVITDCRHPNEYSICLEHGFVPWEICCHPDLRLLRIEQRDRRKLHLAELQHPTEQFTAPATRIDNSGLWEHTREQIDRLLEGLR